MLPLMWCANTRRNSWKFWVKNMTASALVRRTECESLMIKLFFLPFLPTQWFPTEPHAEHIFCFSAPTHLTRVLKDLLMSRWGTAKKSSGTNAESFNTWEQERSWETPGLRNWLQFWDSALALCYWSEVARTPRLRLMHRIISGFLSFQTCAKNCITVWTHSCIHITQL